MGMVNGGDFEGRNGRILVSIAMLPGNGRLSKAYPFYLWLLCVGVSIHISFCGMTNHVMPSHENNAPFDFFDSLSLWILKFAFNTLIFTINFARVNCDKLNSGLEG